MKSRNLVWMAVASSLGLISVAHAQSSGTTAVQPAYQIPDGKQDKKDDGPRSIPLADGASLTPYVNFSYGRDNNLFLANTNRRSSNLVLWNYGANFVLEGRASKFGLLYDSTIGKYASSNDDDYTDYKTLGTAEFIFTSSMGLKLAADYTRGHDPRGSTDRGISGKPDEYRTGGPSVLFAYGANEARGRIELEAGQVDRRYLNNRTSTVGSDRDTQNLAGRFFLKIGPKTSAIFEVRRDDIDYKLESSLQDSKESRYLAGVTWEATAATSGVFKIGRLKKDFAAAGRRDFSGTGWEGNIIWKPLSYSTVTLGTNKSISESTGLGDFTLAKRYSIGWDHEWNSRMTSTVSFSRSDDEFSGNVRKDETDSFGMKLNYKVFRWLTVGGEVTNTKRDSNVSGFNYKKNLYLLTLGATL